MLKHIRLSALFFPLRINSRTISRSVYNKFLLSTFLLLLILTDVRTLQKDGQAKTAGSPGHLVFVEAIKLTGSLVVYLWGRNADRTGTPGYSRVHESQELGESHTLDDLSPTGSNTAQALVLGSPGRSRHNSLQLGTLQSTAAIAIVAVLYALRNYLFAAVAEVVDSLVLHDALSLSTVLTIVLLNVLLFRPISALQLHAALLQFCGLFIIRNTFLSSVLPSTSWYLLLSLVMFSSLAIVMNDHIYNSHHVPTFNSINVILFAFGFITHLSLSLVQHPSGFTATISHSTNWSFASVASPLLDACCDVVALAVIFYLDAAVESAMRSFALAIFLLGLAITSKSTSIGVYTGCAFVIVASISFLRSHQSLSSDSDAKSETHLIIRDSGRRIASLFALFTVLVYVVCTAIRSGLPRPQSFPTLSYLFEYPNCPRKPLPGLAHGEEPIQRPYHEFDNVLLIVFFSHARYDVNLDYYREVYSIYFPNILFIGPASREDKGYLHSYDVLVDSYQADEDLTEPTFYKMAGRMAHHMLYTALREHPCYSGYLWAPFDTLLNVPRLQQFNQRQFWYHSPWGKFVFNPLLVEDAVDSNINKTRHPPPANISPDPAQNITQEWRGWGLDWWWGDPHVGLSECMTAFNKVPLHQRERLARLTNGTTRLIGGSADTLYIPGKYRESFMNTLGLFLETNCFLEIATPTALHLQVPEDEEILFVDHWWIWQKPFNATFVRQKWEEGFEVDTFHTFHWGDKDVDGVWMANPDNIEDVRLLLRESALRQGLDWIE